MNIRFILLGIFEPRSGNGSGGLNIKRTANELLTQKDWKLASADDNKVFAGNSIPEYFFTWQFIHQHQTLDYLFRADNILKLDEEELILYTDESNEQGQMTRRINTYRH
ncbi:MAG: hypothetical protein ACHQFX_03340 [Chitinophagales bacterium]